jgi:hypothetical protein
MQSNGCGGCVRCSIPGFFYLIIFTITLNCSAESHRIQIINLPIPTDREQSIKPTANPAYVIPTTMGDVDLLEGHRIQQENPVSYHKPLQINDRFSQVTGQQ